MFKIRGAVVKSRMLYCIVQDFILFKKISRVPRIFMVGLFYFNAFLWFRKIFDYGTFLTSGHFWLWDFFDFGTFWLWDFFWLRDFLASFLCSKFLAPGLFRIFPWQCRDKNFYLTPFTLSPPKSPKWRLKIKIFRRGISINCVVDFLLLGIRSEISKNCLQFFEAMTF